MLIGVFEVLVMRVGLFFSMAVVTVLALMPNEHLQLPIFLLVGQGAARLGLCGVDPIGIAAVASACLAYADRYAGLWRRY